MKRCNWGVLPSWTGAGRALRLTSVLLAAICLTPLDRAVAQSCSTSGENYNCTISAGTYSSAVSVNARTDGSGSALHTTVTTQGTVVVSVPVDNGPALSIKAAGQNGSGPGAAGSNGQGVTITTQAGLTMTDTSWSGKFLFALYASLYAGNGAASTGDEQGGGGGDTGSSGSVILSVTNTGTITMNLPSATVESGGALYAISQGGQGGKGDKGAGGTGGQATGVTVNNSGAINVTGLQGSNGFAGIAALGFGGNAGATGEEGGNAYGAAGGPSSVTSSGAVTVDWTWRNAGTPNVGLYGIVAQSVGGTGGLSNKDEVDGGSGGFNPASSGAVQTASVTLTAGGDVSVTQSGAPAAYAISISKTVGFNGAGVAAVVMGGNGGDLGAEGDDTSSPTIRAGNGGSVGSTSSQSVLSGQINVTDANVKTMGNDLPGLLVFAQGGTGGNGLPQSQTDPNWEDAIGGSGGSASGSSIQVTASTRAVTITTGGTNSAAIVNMLQGGAGGDGGYYSNTAKLRNAGNGGDGGNAEDVQVTLTGKSGAAITLTTTGDQSAGVVAISQGGSGGAGGELSTALGVGDGGVGGKGGQGGTVTVSLASTSINTSGSNSPGIFAQSIGAAGGNGGGEIGGSASNGGAGGNGGESQGVNVTLDSASSIITTGDGSSGIVAQTLSGAGGIGGSASAIFKATGGNGGTGGNTGNIMVTNDGTIKTKGDNARGIVALAMTGVGGTGGSTYGITYNNGGTGAAGGSVGTVTITNNGSILTEGSGAKGILAQSISGGGGAGGDASGTVVSIGGNADTNPFALNGNTVSISHNAGSITTTGSSAVAILGQSIGGGGGDGGSVTDGTISIGGTGGAGGAGGTVASSVSGSISTSGGGAHGAVMQSIGGGGGNGGNASSDSALITYSIGGSGGSGGNGGPASINTSNAAIVTEGSKASGLIAQSIGGGGGTGGQTFSHSISVGYAAAVAIGGSGGSGGTAAQVSSQMVGGSIASGQNPLLTTGHGTSGSCTKLPCNQLPVDAYGVVVQSIGGGGGAGGSAVAEAVALAIPVSEGVQVGVAASSAAGGSGGSGGDANYVTFAVSQGGKITTAGQGSTGVLLQSIGGGGGAGGDSSALAAVIGYDTQDLPSNPVSISMTATFTVGGTGGSGGSGGPAFMALGGLINVSGGVPTFTPDAAGSPPSIITTYGDFANGVKAQSIGGGGGDAGFGSGNTQNFGTGADLTASISLGAKGGSGGNGDSVIVNVFPTSAITTWGSNAMGVVAQSIGGGGGTSQGGSYSFGGSYDNLNPQVTINVGTTGAGGGMGGAVTVSVQAPITTHSGDAVGVLAQSIGGGGGVGGSAGSDASADNPILAGLNARQDVSNIESGSVTYELTSTVSIGGTGGRGNTGGTVAVNLSSTIATSGDWASGIVAQSIGGGGGKGGTAAATGTGQNSEITINHNIAVGGTGGAGGKGGVVNIGLGSTTAGSTITTKGFAATGVLAQSVGGGGGMAADGSDGAWGDLAVGTAASGKGGAGGNGETVTLTTAGVNKITTTGEAADAVVLQSVGGGGGLAGSGSSAQLSVGPKSTRTTLSAGGGPGATGAGGVVTFSENTGATTTINTTGNNAFGIVAQSVGGGGGIVKMSQNATQLAIAAGLFSTQIGGDATGGQPDNNGGPVKVALNAGSSITTKGTGAHGIIAQSIGGGGGIVGLPGTTPVLTTTAPTGDQTIANGNADVVTVTNGASITVSGAGSIGIVAQSIGSGGGLLLLSDGNTVFAGSVTASLSGSGGHGGAVNVTTNGSIAATGTNGIGVFAQVTGHTAAQNGAITVDVNAAVQGELAAIQVDSPTGSPTATVTVGAGGSLSSPSGKTVLATGGVKVNVENSGGIDGQLDLNGGLLRNAGTYVPGPVLQHDIDNLGVVIVRGSSTVSNAKITNRGVLSFSGTSAVIDALVTTDNGGLTAFLEAASGGSMRLITNAGGAVDISLLSTSGTTAGSIEGAGTYHLGSKQLTVGANDASTVVSGVITDGGLGGGSGGSLVKAGRGTLTLTGANSYTGGTTVLQGVLQGNSTSLQGTILNNASVVFDQTGSGTYAGVMSGSGSMAVQGGGLLNLTGNSTYTGLTTVNATTLLVNGSLASAVNLVNGASLGGSGAVGGLAMAGGVLSPGNSIGTLTVNGKLNQAGGVYQVEVNPQGQSDGVQVNGTATIGSGATVQILPQSGPYVRGMRYTILNATGGISGGYSGINSNFAFLFPSLAYDANNIYLSVVQSFAGGAQSPNQYAVGAALDRASNGSTSGDFNSVLSALSLLSAQQGPGALTSLSGQQYADFGTMNVQGASLFMNALGQQMALARGGTGAGQRLALAQACEIESCVGATTPWSGWASGLGGFGSVLGDANAGTLTYNFGGAAVGVDYRFDPRFVIGLGVGYAHGTQWVNGFLGQGYTDSVSVAAYGSFTQAGFYADVLAGYAYSSNQQRRQIILPGLARTANGSTGANQFLGQIETGYQVPLGTQAQASITPFARLQGSSVTQNGFSESGAQSISLNVAQQSTSSLRTVFGADLAGAIPLDKGRQLDLALRLGWQHEFADTSRPITAAFAGAPSAQFTVYGATPVRDSAVVGLSAKTLLAESVQVFLRYDGQLGGGTDNHALTAGLRMSW